MLVTAVIVITAAAAGFAFIGFRQNRPGNFSPSQSNLMQKIQISSPAFENQGLMPAKFTCDGPNASPPLSISGVPAGTKSLALIMHDPDAPVKGGWTHWMKWNIPPDTETVGEGEEPAGVPGKGSGGNLSYQGPCPPSGIHRYFFKIYALDVLLDLPAGADKNHLEQTMAGHITGQGELVGLYARQK